MFEFVPLNPAGDGPANLLPAALPEVLEETPGQPPSLVGQDSATGARVSHPLGAEDMGAFLTTGTPLPHPEGMAGMELHLGPRGPAGGADVQDDLPQVSDTPADPDLPAQIGIIDAGMAFWNPSFGQRFATAGGIDTAGTRHVIAANVMAQMQTDGDTRAGDRRNRAIMADQLPDSVFATRPGERQLFPAHGLAHGTAMADLVLANAPAQARLHALELPVPVLRDLTGGQMRGIIDAALRAVVLQAAEHLRDAAGGGPIPRFRMVVLIAFGFLGGPHGGPAGRPKFVDRLKQTQRAFAARGIDVELVMPVGNHRQARAHARLPVDTDISWRLLPHDHTPNTLEILHEGAAPAVRITAPNGMQVTRPAGALLGKLVLDGQPVGAVASTPLSNGWSRTRISLTRTASRNATDRRAPFGRWHVGLPDGPEAQVWVLRDETGFEADPAAPARGSWLDDGVYRDRDATGLPALNDPANAGLVRRAGSASVMADPFASVGTVWTDPATGAAQPAPYSALHFDGTEAAVQIDLAEGASRSSRPIGPFGQRAVLGNGSERRFRVAGTSLAAAIEAGRRAAAVPQVA